MGIDAPITAGFHKLPLQDEGGFLVGHRDTGKAPGMSATLVAALPSSFAGGELAAATRTARSGSTWRARRVARPDIGCRPGTRPNAGDR